MTEDFDRAGKQGAAANRCASARSSACYANGAVRTEVPKRRYQNSPGQAKCRPGLQTRNAPLFFFRFGVLNRREEKAG